MTLVSILFLLLADVDLAARIKEWHEAARAADAAAMERLLAPEFTFVNVAGQMIGREAWLKGFRSLNPQQRAARAAAYEKQQMIYDEENIRVYGNVALVTARMHGRAGGSRETAVWLRGREGWRLVHGQITALSRASRGPGTAGQGLVH